MASDIALLVPKKRVEGMLSFLPCSKVLEYARGQIIYNQDRPSTHLYLVICGRVEVSSGTLDGQRALIDVYRTDEFFGELAFFALSQHHEQAISVDKTLVMTWSISEVEDLVMKQPAFGIALIHLLVRRAVGFKVRIHSLSFDILERRLARTLIQLSNRWGVEEQDGTVRMLAFTHELLSRYVGTSREQVTNCMNQLRRKGYLRYSRKGVVFSREALSEWLRQDYHDRYNNGRLKLLCSAQPTAATIRALETAARS